MARTRDLANQQHPYWTAPRGLWLIAGAPTWQPYPCMCRGSKSCNTRCRCWGRTDTDALPRHCCARPKEST